MLISTYMHAFSLDPIKCIRFIIKSELILLIVYLGAISAHANIFGENQSVLLYSVFTPHHRNLINPTYIFNLVT